jgi:ribosomal protein S18 acetylase RimI-like enzyme
MNTFLCFVWLLLSCTVSLASSVSPDCDILYDKQKARLSSTLSASPKINKETFAQEGHVSRIQQYPTCLLCTGTTFHVVPEQAVYEILSDRENREEGANIIGHIHLQYLSNQNMLRISDLKVKKKERRKGHGTRALETLFRDLRNRTVFQNTLVTLEVADSNVAAITLYKSLGFQASRRAYDDVTNMTVLLNDTKFPFYNRTKKS